MRFAFRYCPFRIAKKPISGCDMVLFGLQYRPFRKPKWCFLQSDKMLLRHKSLIFNILENRLFSAYLRPTKSLLANTRLFFGVYRETRRETTESGYKLKAAHTASLRQTKTTLIPHRNSHRLLRYFPTDIERFYKKDSTPPSIDPRRHDVSSTGLNALCFSCRHNKKPQRRPADTAVSKNTPATARF